MEAFDIEVTLIFSGEGHLSIGVFSYELFTFWVITAKPRVPSTCFQLCPTFKHLSVIELTHEDFLPQNTGKYI